MKASVNIKALFAKTYTYACPSCDGRGDADTRFYPDGVCPTCRGQKQVTGRLIAPTWPADGGAYGGHIEAMKGLPIVRYFPHGNLRRRVSVHIATWIGTSPGARHYYASLREEANSIWDGRPSLYKPEGIWTHFWDDDEGQGQEFKEDFLSRTSAQAYVRRMVAKHFPRKTHFIREDFGGERPPKWLYQEGD